MANTQNLDLVKPLGTDHALVSVLNSNSDKIDAYAGAVNASLDGLRDGLGILADGNTHAAITSGQFVYVKNHQTLPQGLYQATTNIAANGTLSTSNLTADPKGGLNTLSEQIGTLNNNIAPFLGLGSSTSSILQIIVANTKGTLGGSFASKFDEMSDDGELRIFKNSNAPSDAPSDNQWGGALILKIDSTTGVAFSFSNTYFGYSQIANGAIAGWIKLS